VIFTELSAGKKHFLALNQFGLLFAVGDNSKGQLGVGDILPRKSIVAVPTPADTTKVTHISALMYSSACITVDGLVWCFGEYNNSNTLTNIPFHSVQCGVGPTELVRVVCGDDFLCVQASDGVTWGTGINCPFTYTFGPKSNCFNELLEIPQLRGMQILTPHPFMIYTNPGNECVYMIQGAYTYYSYNFDGEPKLVKPYGPHEKSSEPGVPDELKLDHTPTHCLSRKPCSIQ
jgi:hypothetical protein